MEKAFCCAPDFPVVQTNYGPVRGYRFREISSFKGIPYGRAVRFHAPQPPQPAPAPAPEDQYAALQRQLRQANDAIPDPVMTAKISRLEDVSARIFALAKKDPDKKAQLQKFMDYYLPTALKLLNTYAQLSAQDVQGSNITEAKQSIERSMDLLITAFENQLDKLFASDALDVSTDIAALEGMLNLDGLTGGDFAPRS